MIDLNNIARQSLKIAEHRKLETDALSCIKHCAGEIAEATQAVDNYQSCVCEETEKKMADEVADVIMCMLTLSAEMGINIEQAILNCLEKNRKRARAKYEADKVYDGR
jgi:NTP pyrophosphatase (non-canonical NTP hydrolase)